MKQKMRFFKPLHCFMVCALFVQVQAQENCFNGLDDTGNGLVDLNDTLGCDCQLVVPDVEHIINGSVNDLDTCYFEPTAQWSDMPTGWFKTNNNSPDFFHSDCPGYGGGQAPPTAGLNPGEGALGVRGYNYFSPVVQENFYTNEFFAQCLGIPLLAGQLYEISFDLSGLLDDLWLIPPHPFNFGLFGTTQCPFDFPPIITQEFLCALDVDNLGITVPLIEAQCEGVSGTEWNNYSFQFSPDVDIVGIIMGPSCIPMPIQGPIGGFTPFNFWFFRNISIRPVIDSSSTLQPPEISINGSSCTGYAFTANGDELPNPQWFVNGVAVQGATGLNFQLPPDSLPEVTFGIRENGACAFAVPVATEPTPPPQIEVSIDEDNCINNTLPVTVGFDSSLGLALNWSNGAQGASLNLGFGTYQLEATQLTTGCNTVITVDVPPCGPLNVNLNNVELCQGEDASLSPEVLGGLPPYTFEWAGESVNEITSAAVVVSPSETATYAVTVIDSEGTIAVASAQVQIKPEPSLPDLPERLELCPGESLTINAFSTDALGYLWNTGSTEESITVNRPGIFSLDVFTSCFTFNASITVVETPGARLPAFQSSVVLCLDSTTLIGLPESDLYDVVWENGEKAFRIPVSEAGRYAGRYLHPCGERALIFDVETVACTCDIYIPNAFTPNADGVNELLRVTTDCDFDFYEFTIFNRLGQVVFNSQNPIEFWNGDFKGNGFLADPGIYQYLLRAQPSNPILVLEPIEKTGYIVLLR